MNKIFLICLSIFLILIYIVVKFNIEHNNTKLFNELLDDIEFNKREVLSENCKSFLLKEGKCIEGLKYFSDSYFEESNNSEYYLKVFFKALSENHMQYVKSNTRENYIYLYYYYPFQKKHELDMIEIKLVKTKSGYLIESLSNFCKLVENTNNFLEFKEGFQCK